MKALGWIKNSDKTSSKKETVPSSEWLRHLSSLNERSMALNTDYRSVKTPWHIEVSDKFYNTVRICTCPLIFLLK